MVARRWGAETAGRLPCAWGSNPDGRERRLPGTLLTRPAADESAGAMAMHVLGIWGTAPGVGKTPARGGHDASAVLLRDGRLIAAVEEERVCRVKHTRRPPQQAIDLCLREGG